MAMLNYQRVHSSRKCWLEIVALLVGWFCISLSFLQSGRMNPEKDPRSWWKKSSTTPLQQASDMSQHGPFKFQFTHCQRSNSAQKQHFSHGVRHGLARSINGRPAVGKMCAAMPCSVEFFRWVTGTISYMHIHIYIYMHVWLVWLWMNLPSEYSYCTS